MIFKLEIHCDSAHELQCLVPHIEPGDMELLEAAGVLEEEAQRHKKGAK